MSFSDHFLDELRARLRTSEVVGKKVRLQKRGKEFAGLCPFHQEKTPSFYVNDAKGFYHCFGCGAHGDIIRFMMENERLPFLDAIEKLAAQAGLTVPKPSAEATAQMQRKQTLYDVMEAAARWFQSQFQSNKGDVARSYLEKRGIRAETIHAFRLGYAPDQRDALQKALRMDGITNEQLIATGLIGMSEEKDRAPYDRFRHRLMFPIFDVRGRVIAFGGRLLGEGNAKYLNSPETELFHKGSVLYNEAAARAAAESDILVAEGYMDVIALSQAGFKYAVAPLGTAVTEMHLKRLWSIAPEPILCLDGDNAGIRAMQRVAQLALPLLEPGHSLQFLQLPAGEDPDSLIKQKGAAAFGALLKNPIPLSDVIWNLEFSKTELRTPEQKAGLSKRLMEEQVRAIKHPEVSRAYKEYFYEKLRDMREQHNSAKQHANAKLSAKYKPNDARPWHNESRSVAIQNLPMVDKNTLEGSELLMLMTIAHNPDLLEDQEIYHELTHFEWISEALSNLCHEIIHLFDTRENDTPIDLIEALKQQPELLPLIERAAHVEAGNFFKRGVAKAEARRGWSLVRLEHFIQSLNLERSDAYRRSDESRALELSRYIDAMEAEKRKLMMWEDE